MSRTIQVGNLDYSIGNRELAKLFAPYGVVQGARISVHFETRQSTGVGFVEMATDQEGEAAIAALNGREYLHRPLSVGWSKQGIPQAMYGPMNIFQDVTLPSKAPEQRGLPSQQEDG